MNYTKLSPVHFCYYDIVQTWNVREIDKLYHT